MKAVIFGLGSIGQRHARLLKERDCEIYSVRSGKSSGKTPDGITAITEEELSTIKPDFAVIANPTSLHVETATRCAQDGIDLFIEKPLSDRIKGLDALRKATEKHGVTVYVGYCLRFHPIIRWLKENLKGTPAHITCSCSSYLPSWRKTPHLESFAANKGMGGGVILELSHEIDYLTYLFGTPEVVAVQSGRQSDVTVDAEDSADILLKFNSSHCNLHLDFLSRHKSRELVIDYHDRTLVADLIKNTITIIDDEEQKTENFRFERDDMYREQLAYFIENRKGELMNGLAEASATLKTILAIREAAS